MVQLAQWLLLLAGCGKLLLDKQPAGSWGDSLAANYGLWSSRVSIISQFSRWLIRLQVLANDGGK